jgi:serine protease Do
MWRATVTQENQNGNDLCGWIGVAVRPMTAEFAASLGMAVPYGAIFDQPEPGSPAANAQIEQGDVVTAIGGSPLMRSNDFAGIISKMAPGTTVALHMAQRRSEAGHGETGLGIAPNERVCVLRDAKRDPDTGRSKAPVSAPTLKQAVRR